jgi:hypothetical protein
MMGYWDDSPGYRRRCARKLGELASLVNELNSVLPQLYFQANCTLESIDSMVQSFGQEDNF